MWGYRGMHASFIRYLIVPSAVFGLWITLSEAAEEVDLKSNDGSVNLRGELLGFEDGFYIIRTALGEFRMSSARVRCEGAACPQIDIASADVRISGSETVGEELMPIILGGYAASFGAEADVKTGNNAFEKVVSLMDDGGFGDEVASYSIISEGTTEGFTDLLEGASELAMSSRAARRSELRAFAEAGHGNLSDLSQERIIAVDSLRVVVSPDNPVEAIAMEQLAQVYAGEISNWSQLGGLDQPITVYTRRDGTGTFDLFSEKVLRPGRRSVSPSATVVAGNIEMANAVAGDPGGIGFVGFAFERGAKTLSIVTECGITVTADAFSAKTEEYPLERRLFVYSRNGDMSEDAQRLFEFLSQETVDGLVAKAGFVDLGVDQGDQVRRAERLRTQMDQSTDQWELSLMRELYIEKLEWDRLSTSLRFQVGSSELDNKAKSDLGRLVRYLVESGADRARVVGFTDADGPFAANLRLAERRALQVVQELRAAGGDQLNGIELTARGFGELAPAGCNESFDGKRINRRVEIWLPKEG